MLYLKISRRPQNLKFCLVFCMCDGAKDVFTRRICEVFSTTSLVSLEYVIGNLLLIFYWCFLQYKKELQGELKGFESQILIKKGYNEHSIILTLTTDQFKNIFIYIEPW